MLKQTGFYLNVQNGSGETPLHQACRDGRTAVAKTLLTLGADANMSSRADLSDFPVR